MSPDAVSVLPRARLAEVRPRFPVDVVHFPIVEVDENHILDLFSALLVFQDVVLGQTGIGPDPHRLRRVRPGGAEQIEALFFGHAFLDLVEYGIAATADEDQDQHEPTTRARPPPPATQTHQGIPVFFVGVLFLCFFTGPGSHSFQGCRPTEKTRSMRARLPCPSLTDTVSFPLGSSVIGRFSFSSQTPGDDGRNFTARSVPASAPSTGKSAVTRKRSRSRPAWESCMPTRIRVSGPLFPARGSVRVRVGRWSSYNQPKPRFSGCFVSKSRSMGQPRSIQRISVRRSSSDSGFTLPALTARSEERRVGKE